MSDLIKTITVGAKQYDIGVKYENVADAPSAEDIAALKEQVAALTPKKATFVLDEHISDVTIDDYETQEADDKHSWVNDELTYVYARNGEFGYTCIDGTGQVNFEPAIAEGYDAIVPTVEGTYNKFKTPYATCKDNLYRFTKLESDLAISLAAAKEADMPSFAVNYTLSMPEGYTGDAPVVTEYRTNDAMLAAYKPNIVTFTDGSYASVAYNKDTGYPDKSLEYKDDGTVKGGLNAQVNFTLDCALAEGYTLSVTASSTYKNFNKPGYIDDDGRTWTDQYQLTKLKDDTTINIVIAAPASVSYIAGTDDNSYKFSTDATEIPATVGLGSDLVFAFYHQTNKDNPTKNAECIPDGASKTLPTADACLERIESVKIKSADYTVTADMITVSGKKATVTIPGSAITGDVVITLKTVAA